MLVPIVESLLDQLMEQIAVATATELDEEMAERVKALGAGMTRYMMTGMNPFYRKWIKELREGGYADPQLLLARLEAAFKLNDKEDDSEEDT